MSDIQQRNAELFGILSSDFVANTGELHLSHTSVSANYSAAKETCIFGTSGAGGITVTLPSAANQLGKTYIITKVDSGAGALTVDCAGADTINGDADYDLTQQWDSIIIQSDGVSAWRILSVQPGTVGGDLITIAATLPGAVTVRSEAPRYPADGPFTITEVYVTANTASTANSIIVDVSLNGVSIFNATPANRPTLGVGVNAATSGAPDTTAVVKNDYFQVQIDQKGTDAEDLVVAIRGIRS